MLEALLVLLNSLLPYNNGAITDDQIREIQQIRSELIADNLITAEELARVDGLINQIEADYRVDIIWTDN